MQLLFNNLAPVDSHCIGLSAETSHASESVDVSTDAAVTSVDDKTKLSMKMIKANPDAVAKMSDTAAQENNVATTVNLNEDSETNEKDPYAVFDNLKNAPVHLLPTLISRAFRDKLGLTFAKAKTVTQTVAFIENGETKSDVNTITINLSSTGIVFDRKTEKGHAVANFEVDWSDANDIKINNTKYETNEDLGAALKEVASIMD